MTGQNRFLTSVLVCALLSTVSCGGEGDAVLDPEEEATFNLLTGCSGTCVAGFLTMMDGFDDLMTWLASGTDTTVGDRSLNLTTGAFGFDLDMDGRSGSEIQFRGTIDPLTGCDDGMVKGDVCIAAWDMFHIQTTARMGEGTFSVIGLGNSAAPSSTPSYRVTITRENTWIETDDGCRLDITGLDLIVHPFGDPQMRSAIVNFKITADGVVDEVRGGMAYAYDPSSATQSISLTGQHTIGSTTTNFSCTMNLDTFTLSCS
ncbi:MAG: hypothetical protein OEY20_04215 [Gemmatimonadota bacterium]|nr:hypothetical protein [Gemmatimonadota bacterium]MDH5196433.1 hypothetical protein [Gemmatimonadota bacterium]